MNARKLEALLNEIDALPYESPDKGLPQPVSRLIAWAEDLCEHATADRKALLEATMPRDLLPSIRHRIEALKEAERRFEEQKKARKDATRQLKSLVADARDVKQQLLMSMDIAYEDLPDHLRTLRVIREGSTQLRLAEDLLTLVTVARISPEPLARLKPVPRLLDLAGSQSDQLGPLLTRRFVLQKDASPKVLRDKAFFDLQEGLRRLCRYGRFAFADDPDRAAPYVDAYQREKRRGRRRRGKGKGSQGNGEGTRDGSEPSSGGKTNEKG